MPTSTMQARWVEARTFVGRAPCGLLTRGEFVESAGGQTFKTIQSATGEPICEVASAGVKTVWTDSR